MIQVALLIDKFTSKHKIRLRISGRKTIWINKKNQTWIYYTPSLLTKRFQLIIRNMTNIIAIVAFF
jgi:hypothetical protein